MTGSNPAILWCRRNLFASPGDSLITVVTVPLLAWATLSADRWALVNAHWTVIPDSLRVMMVGVYPADATWRAWVAAALLSGLCAASLGVLIALGRAGFAVLTVLGGAAVAVSMHGGGAAAPWVLGCCVLAVAGWAATAGSAAARRWLPAAWAVGLTATFAVLAPPGMETWGGLLLSVLLTIVTSILSLPLGVLLAFGRRSRIASVRVCSTAYIEVMRSVPLILVVYWIWIVVPLLAPDRSISDVLRGMVGFVAFFSAYVAEYVRSGLQAVPKGQVEAAQSVGMGGFDVAWSIVLPQALRVVVPALVGNVLDIFNAAPLVFIIGLTDFLRAGQMVLANPQFSGATYEVYVFLFAVYFAVGSIITFGARRLETHLARGAR